MIIQVKVKEVLVDEKGGPGSGNFGHAGIPGSVGGSAPSGGGASSIASYPSAKSIASQFIASGKKRDAGVKPTEFEDKTLRDNGFERVEGTNAYIRENKTPTTFEKSFTLVQIYRKPAKFQNPAENTYIGTHFNGENGKYIESSEHAYASTRERATGMPITRIIDQIDSYQSR